MPSTSSQATANCEKTINHLLTTLDNNDIALAIIDSDKEENAVADDPNIRGPRDRARINLDQDYEVRYWTQALGVSEEELNRLVAKHGNSADAVRKALSKA